MEPDAVEIYDTGGFTVLAVAKTPPPRPARQTREESMAIPLSDKASLNRQMTPRDETRRVRVSVQSNDVTFANG